jgi:hypothetical protein
VIRYDSTVIRCDTLFFRFKRKNISLNGRITAYHCRIIAYHKRITSVSQRITNTSQQFDTPTFRAGATLLTVLARGSAEGVPGAATLLTVLARGSAQAVPWAVSVLTVTTIHESLKAVSLLESPSKCSQAPGSQAETGAQGTAPQIHGQGGGTHRHQEDEPPQPDRGGRTCFSSRRFRAVSRCQGSLGAGQLPKSLKPKDGCRS